MHKRKKQVCDSWRMDVTYINVKGRDMFLYRALDKYGNKVDFLLTKRRQKMLAQKFFNKAIGNKGKPKIINIDKSGANSSALWTVNKRSLCSKKIKICKVKYLNNIVEQDHRRIKRQIRIMTGFKEFESAQRTLSGIEVVSIIKKDQIINPRFTSFKTYCSLVA